jgi:hypothetical protein
MHRLCGNLFQRVPDLRNTRFGCAGCRDPPGGRHPSCGPRWRNINCPRRIRSDRSNPAQPDNQKGVMRGLEEVPRVWPGGDSWAAAGWRSPVIPRGPMPPYPLPAAAWIRCLAADVRPARSACGVRRVPARRPQTEARVGVRRRTLPLCGPRGGDQVPSAKRGPGGTADIGSRRHVRGIPSARSRADRSCHR